MHRYWAWVSVSALVGVACASGDVVLPSDPAGSGGAGAEGGADPSPGGSATGGDEGGLVPQSCPDATFATGIDADGMLQCAPLDIDVVTAVEHGCSLYLGWRDGCNGCTNGPAKVGRVDGVSCDNVAGADNTCIDATLGATSLPLFGLNTDGDVDGNDMFYAGLHCPETGETGLAGPCEAGEHAVRVSGDGAVECMPTDRIAIDYVRHHCRLYFGWRDGCNGCTDPPSKWGVQQDISCENGAGADNTCGVPFVDADWLPLVGINTDGDVDNNDTFFMGIACDDIASESVSGADRCPFGTLLTGVNDDGTLACTAPHSDIAPVVRDDCGIYFGYRDSCNGCVDPPSKWAAARTTSCDPSGGGSCNTHDLGGNLVELLGIRSDGDVDGNDKFYGGFGCH